MANEEHVALLKQGVDVWNAWRSENPNVCPDLRGADLSRANLRKAELFAATLRGADLSGASLFQAFLSGANLSGADLRDVILSEAILRGANPQGADLGGAFLREAILSGANLSRANLFEASLRGAQLIETNLGGANLPFARVVQADLTAADLTGCRIYGVSAWGLKLDGAKQQNLIITAHGEPEITVDNIEVAQFVYLLLHNQKIRDVIDTIGKKSVLILGRFTPERKAVLDAIRGELRKREYLPILFDFDKPTSKDLTGTVLTLAHMARFIIADLTDPSCSPYEVAKVADAFVPVQPILLSGNREFAMFADLQRRHHWFLPIYPYQSQEQLIAEIGERVIRPAENKVQELRSQVP